jgi:uncharacterized protein YyaL (SSP411 family)
MIGSLAEAGRVLDEARYIAAAERALADIQTRLTRDDGGLYRTARAGKAHLDAYLEDYAYLGDALIDLYEASKKPEHLELARTLGERMLKDFRDHEGGGFYQTAHQHERLIARSRDAQDDAMPNPSAIAAQLCARLGHYFDLREFREAAERTIETFGRVLPRAPRAFVSMLAVLDLLERGPLELALVGPVDDLRTRAFERAIARHYLPNRLLAHARGAGHETLPLLAGKQLVAGAPALYVCRNFACAAPITDPAQVETALHAPG